MTRWQKFYEINMTTDRRLSYKHLRYDENSIKTLLFLLIENTNSWQKNWNENSLFRKTRESKIGCGKKKPWSKRAFT